MKLVDNSSVRGRSRCVASLPLLMFFIAAWCACGVVSASEISSKDVEAVLSRLDREVAKRDVYKEARAARIDSLRRRRDASVPGSSAWFDGTMEVARDYSSFNNDSALYYFTEGLERAHTEGLDSVETEFRIRRATYLSASGYISDALAEMERVDTAALAHGQRQTYYASARQMYSYISNYYDNGFLATCDNWNNRAIVAQRELLSYLDDRSSDYRLNLGEYLYLSREYAKSRAVLKALINDINEDSSLHAIACHILASIARTRGDRNEYMYYLALSAITDLRLATLEVTSIQELGGVLFETGDTNRAHDYLVVAMNNVVEGRASVRMSQTSELLTMIENDHLRQIASWHRLASVVIAILVVCLLALVAAIYFLRRQLARVAMMKLHLEESNRTKEVYISQFLTLCSIYMDKLKQFCKLTNRKISAGQVDELFKITKSGKFIEEQSKEFYSVF
ncbi:MAG: hypothetical protein K2L78_00775, partial [Muribaculaceae bacterium]|nr:hypothetical protein [Muribaculaceae bacterium]